MTIIQGKKILIVDDDLGCRESIRLSLESKGAITQQAESGDDAFVILKNNSFDLITTGIRMPGMTGIELIKNIRVRDIRTPIIVITGSTTLGVVTRCAKFGVKDYVARPFEVDDLINTAEKALEDTNKMDIQVQNIPTWKQFIPSLSDATPEQAKFYYYWLEQFEKENFIDIQDNDSYLFVYLYDVIGKFIKTKDIDYLLTCFGKMQKGYVHREEIMVHLSSWTKDAYLYVEDYDRWWEYVKAGSFRIEDIINIKSKCSDTSIDGQNILKLAGTKSLTKFGRENAEQISQLATIFLNDFHKKNGKNIIEYFCAQFNYLNLTEEDFSKLKEFYSNEKDFILWKKIYEEDYKKMESGTYYHYLFSGIPSLKKEFSSADEFLDYCEKVKACGHLLDKPGISLDCIPYIITDALEGELKRILREAENTVREEKNLPKIGEGWISETELFYKICETFPNEKIVHHGRPVWLSPQHIDIYFPLRNIGIEYQGYQHQAPVDFFGGNDSFKKQQKLDMGKREKCKKNGCRLLYVYDNYTFNDIRQEIEDILNNRN
jgi:CheY-like chemotaxis protein